jgi:hypothetical protein
MCPRCQYPNIPGAVEWVLKCIAALVAYQLRRQLLVRLSHRSNGRAEFAAKCIRDPMVPGVKSVDDGKR